MNRVLRNASFSIGLAQVAAENLVEESVAPLECTHTNEVAQQWTHPSKPSNPNLVNHLLLKSWSGVPPRTSGSGSSLQVLAAFGYACFAASGLSTAIPHARYVLVMRFVP